MTDDIKRRLDFDNPSVKIQAVSKLRDLIIAKKPTESQISNTTPEIVELRLLLDRCSDQCAVVVSACGDALVSLVRQGHAEFTFILRSLLNIVPSVKKLCGVVKSISDLLILQVLSDMKQIGRHETPYSIRSVPHPFITILTNRKDASHFLLEQVVAIFTHPDENVHVNSVECLRPFLHFVLLDPSWKAEHSDLRSGLQRATLYSCSKWLKPAFAPAARETVSKRRDCAQSQLSFLVDIIPFLKVDSVSYGEVCQYVRELVHFVTVSPFQGDLVKIAGQLGCYALSVCCRLCKLGCDVASLIQGLVEVTDIYPQCLSSPVNVLLLSDLLSRSQVCHQGAALALGERLLQNDEACAATLRANLTLPILQLMSLPDSSHSYAKRNKVVCARLLQLILRDKQKEQQYPYHEITLSPDSEDYLLQNYAKLAATSFSQKTERINWLKTIKNGLTVCNSAPSHVTRMIVSLLVIDMDRDVIGRCLENLALIANGNPEQAIDMVATLLFKIGMVTDPESKFVLLSALPKMASHKLCTGPIVKMIQALAANPRLRPFAIRLMTSLWKQQDRCFPQLQEMLIHSETGSSVNDLEMKLAKAASIKEICFLRPHQHGADMLSPLSDILNKCITPPEGAVASLALEGLYALCFEEVVDIRTVWMVLSERLNADQRLPVIRGVCKLLSLVPQLSVNTEEYQTFVQEVVTLLWKHIVDDRHEVVVSSFEALSAFPAESFNLSHLPFSVCEDIMTNLEDGKNDEAVEDVINESLSPASMSVPAICYLRLLKRLPHRTQSGFAVFLKSLVRQEVANLPRGIHQASLRRHTGVGAQNKALLAIPGQIKDRHQTNHQPGLRAGYAASLLFCYDPQIPVGQDGRPRKQYVVSHGRQYQEMLSLLLTEVQWDLSDWHRLTLQAQAWVSFMDRCYNACVNCRHGEIEIQLRHGHITDAEEAELSQDTAWVWVRDHLTDLIKKTSRGSPTSQANSLLALAGLAVHSSHHSENLSPNALKALKETPEHLSQSHWMNIVCNTFMAILDVTFEPSGRILAVCQQKPSGSRTPASILARSASCVSLAQLVPLLVATDLDRIYAILDLLTPGLPGQSRADQSEILQFHCGLGLGMFIGRLFEEGFSDVAGIQGMVAIWKAVEVLESCCYNESIDHRCGSMLGLGLCTSSMCLDVQTDARVHVRTVHSHLQDMVKCTEDFCGQLSQALCMSLAMVTVNAYSVNILDQSEVDGVVSLLMDIQSQHQDVAGLTIGLGGLCCNLQVTGHPTIVKYSNNLYAAWQRLLSNENTVAAVKMAAANGLVALTGSEKAAIMTQHDDITVLDHAGSSSVNMVDVIKSVSAVATSGERDLSLQNHACWLLGHLYAAACTVTSSRASVPLNYSYLPESSILRAAVDELLSANRNGPESTDHDVLTVIWNSLLDGPRQVLPPINWAGLLSPFMKLGFGGCVQEKCLKLGVTQTSGATSAVMFLTPWMVAPLFATLNKPCQHILFESLATLAKSVPSSKLQEFLNKSCMQPFGMDLLDHGLCLAVLKGLKESLTTIELTQAVTLLLYKTLEQCYQKVMMFKSEEKNRYELLVALGECMALVPDSVVDRITEKDFTDPGNIVQTLFIRSYLTGHGSQPIHWLSPCVDFLTNCDTDLVIRIVSPGFYHMTLTNNENTSVASRQQWLLQLMGHIKNLASDPNYFSSSQLVICAVHILAAAVYSWSGLFAGVLGDIQPLDFTNDHRFHRWTAVRMITALPHALVAMLSVSPWKHITPKMVDWLQTMFSLIKDVSLRNTFKGCLLSLRYSVDFQNLDTWTRVYSTLATEICSVH